MRLYACCSLGAVSMLAGMPVGAQDGGPWRQTFAVYLLGAGMDGEIGIGPAAADADVSFGDVLDNLRSGAMMAFGARNDRWAIGVDAIYLDLEASKQLSLVRFDAKTTQTMLSVDGAYRVGERFEVLVGARYNELDSQIAATVSGVAQLAQADRDWVDPYVGGRVTAPLGDRWSVVVRADVGGFGVGSELAWQFLAHFDWHLSDRFDVLFGYRVIDIDYEDGEGLSRFTYDVRSSGPLVGVAWQF